jgi:hypothetical protein
MYLQAVTVTATAAATAPAHSPSLPPPLSLFQVPGRSCLPFRPSRPLLEISSSSSSPQKNPSQFLAWHLLGFLVDVFVCKARFSLPLAAAAFLLLPTTYFSFFGTEPVAGAVRAICEEQTLASSHHSSLSPLALQQPHSDRFLPTAIRQ